MIIANGVYVLLSFAWRGVAVNCQVAVPIFQAPNFKYNYYNLIKNSWTKLYKKVNLHCSVQIYHMGKCYGNGPNVIMAFIHMLV